MFKLSFNTRKNGFVSRCAPWLLAAILTIAAPGSASAAGGSWGGSGGFGLSGGSWGGSGGGLFGGRRPIRNLLGRIGSRLGGHSGGSLGSGGSGGGSLGSTGGSFGGSTGGSLAEARAEARADRLVEARVAGQVEAWEVPSVSRVHLPGHPTDRGAQVIRAICTSPPATSRPLRLIRPHLLLSRSSTHRPSLARQHTSRRQSQAA